jgi:hypothetical protein
MAEGIGEGPNLVLYGVNNGNPGNKPLKAGVLANQTPEDGHEKGIPW